MGDSSTDDREAAEMSVYIAIKTAPKYMRRNLVGKSPNEGDRAAHAFTDHIMAALKGYRIIRIPGHGTAAHSTPEQKN